MIIDSPIISGSYLSTGSLSQTGNVSITGSLNVTAGITGSFTGSLTGIATSASFAYTASSAVNASASLTSVSSSYALTASYLTGYVSPFPYSGSAQITGSLGVTGSITATGTLTAQTLVVQTITSSIEYSSGSNIFGSQLTNTQTFTGSVNITGSGVNLKDGVFSGSGANLFGIPSSGITGLNLSQISSGSVSASISPNLGLLINTSVSASNFTGSFTGSFTGIATSASYASNAATLNNTASSIFATTGSNQFNGNQSVSGSINTQYNVQASGYVQTALLYNPGALEIRSFYSPLQVNSNGAGIFLNDNVSVTGSFKVTGSSTFYGNSSVIGGNRNTLYLKNSNSSGNQSNMIEMGSNGTAAVWSIINDLNADGTTINQLDFYNTALGNSPLSLKSNGSAQFMNSVSASSFTGSYTGSLTGIATSASYAQTASYLLGYISPFPYSGSAAITGSLVITGSVAISTLTTSSGVRYVIADQNGLISAQTASAAIFTTQRVISTANQTTFPITNGYATGYVTVFVNGTKLSTDEFVDTSGTNIVFLTGSNSGDVVEFEKYLPAAGVSNNTLRTTNYFTASLGQTSFSVNYTPGLVDVFYNGSKLDNTEYTAANGTSIVLATGSAAGDKVEVDVYSYQVGAFSGIGGTGAANQLAYFNTTNSITGSDNFTVSGSAIIITGSLIVSGSGTLINIGPAQFSGSVSSTGGFSGSFSGSFTGLATSASYAYTASSAVNAFSASNAVSASYSATSSYANAFTVANTLTAQTLVVQTITSSIEYSSGSNIFGSSLSNNQTFTGSVNITGSLTILGTPTVGSAYGGTVGETRDLYLGNTVILRGYNEDGGSNLGFRIQTWNSGPVQALNIKGNGNVGIGLTNPGYKLDVTGSARVTDILTTYCPSNYNGTGLVIQATSNTAGGSQPGLQFNNSAAQGKFNIYYDYASNTLQFGNTLGTTFAILNGSGSLGMGISPNTWYITYRNAIQLASGMGLWGYNGSYSIGHVSANYYVNAAGADKYIGSDAASDMYIHDGGFYFRTAVTGTADATISWTNALSIGNTGYLTSTATNSFTSANYDIWNFLAPNQSGGALSFNIGQSLSHYNNAAIKFYYAGNGSASNRLGLGFYDNDGILSITAGGYVGIGSTNPAGLLDVVGSASSTRPAIYMTQGGYGQIVAQDQYHGMIFRGYPTNYTDYAATATDVMSFYEYGGEFRFYQKYASGLTLQAKIAAGVIYASNTTVQSISDIRTKENIRTSNEGLEVINALRPVRFDFKDGFNESKKNQLGFIAQEIETVFPDAVSEWEKEDGQIYKTVGPGALIPVLVKALQQANAKITVLEEKLERNNIQ